MEFLFYLALVLLVLYVFFLYPIVAILRSDDYIGWSKFYAFLIVLVTNWLGYIILKIAARKR